jgi:hypothetical protein
LEAIFAKQDVHKALEDLCPVDISLGDGGGNILISEPRDLELVPEVGLRTSVSIQVHWPVLGIQVPVSARSTTLIMRPEILKGDSSEQLSFKFRLEGLDIASFPSIVDRKIVELINNELEKKHVELSWNFIDTLSHVFELPPTLASAQAIELRAAWGEVRITSEALVLAVSFRVAFERRGAVESKRLASSPTSKPPPVSKADALAKVESRRIARRRSRSKLAWMGGAAVLAGLGVSLFIHLQRRPKTFFESLWDLEVP